MHYKKITTILLPLALICLLSGQNQAQQTPLEDLFSNPPEEAKPRGYWIWAHGNFDYRTIKSELKAFKEMGLGGADIFDMGISDPYDVIPPGNRFMGEAMLDGIAFALREAKKLGLEMGLSVSNGWNAGGDWTRADEKIMRLLFWQDTLHGPTAISEIGFPDVPTTFKKPYGEYALFPQFGTDGFPEFYQDVALFAYPLSDDSASADPDKVLYFDADRIEGNRIEFDLPPGRWILTRAVVTPLGQKMWVRSDHSNGFIMDHYSRKATKNHFEYIIDKLEKRVGGLGASALERLYLASFEAEDYIIWSPELKQVFFAQHGYEIDPYMPVFAGQKIVDEATTERFLHDYRSTVSEMFVNNHYRQASEICRAHGILLASESGGPGVPLHYVPTEDLKALGAVDIMRGEFWNMPQRWDDKNGNNLLQVVKNIGSAAHIYGRKVVEMEAFTSQRKHWRESPFELKPLADRAFCEGMTRVVYHTMPHSPPEAGVPGWSYQAGTHIHPKMTWWPMSRPFHQYLARCSALLMQGRFVADVAYYYGSEIPNFALAKHVRPDLGPGYDYDDLNTEVLLRIEEVDNGRIRLPGGMEYEVLVLPDTEKMELEVLQKIEELLRKGATILGPKPTRVYGLSQYREKERTLHQLADQIWGKAKNPEKVDRPYGQGRIVSGKTVREVLWSKGIAPDVQYQGQAEDPVLDFLHRTTGREEIYFIRNTGPDSISREVLFRSGDLRPQWWDPITGERQMPALYRVEEVGVRLPVRLAGYGSAFIVFKAPERPREHIEKITLDGNVVFPAVWLLHQQGEVVFQPHRPGRYEMTYHNGKTKVMEVSEKAFTKELQGPWDVRFPFGWGLDPLQEFDELADWTKSTDGNLRHFSGTATYRKTFTLVEEELEAQRRYFLDLGRVGETARIYLNGQDAGISIFPPHRLEVTGLLKSGENRLVVEVANTWLNRLKGDLHKPLNEQYTRSNVGNKEGTEHRPWRDQPLAPSGLLGPVRVIGKNIRIINDE